MYNAAAILTNLEENRFKLYSLSGSVDKIRAKAKKYIDPISPVLVNIADNLDDFLITIEKIFTLHSDLDSELIQSSIDSMAKNLLQAKKSFFSLKDLRTNMQLDFFDHGKINTTLESYKNFYAQNFQEHYSKDFFDNPHLPLCDSQNNHMNGAVIQNSMEKIYKMHEMIVMSALLDFLELEDESVAEAKHIDRAFGEVFRWVSRNFVTLPPRAEINKVYFPKLFALSEDLEAKADLLLEEIKLFDENPQKCRNGPLSFSRFLLRYASLSGMKLHEVEDKVFKIFDKEDHGAYKDLVTALVTGSENKKKARLSEVVEVALLLFSFKQKLDNNTWDKRKTLMAKSLADFDINQGEDRALLNMAQSYSSKKLGRINNSSSSSEESYLLKIDNQVETNLKEFRNKGLAHIKTFYQKYKMVFLMSGFSQEKFSTIFTDFLLAKKIPAMEFLMGRVYKEAILRNTMNSQDAAVIIKTLTDLVASEKTKQQQLR